MKSTRFCITHLPSMLLRTLMLLLVFGFCCSTHAALQDPTKLTQRPVIEFQTAPQEPARESIEDQETDQNPDQDASKPGAAQDESTESDETNSSQSEAPQTETESQTEDAEKEADSETRSSSRNARASRRDQIIRDGETMRSLFNQVTQTVAKSTVSVKSGNRQLALGVIVDENGFILTKKSELRGDLICQLHDGSEYSAIVVGVHDPSDLALLKIEKKKLLPVVWNQSPESTIAGSWVITANPKGEAESLGVVSVAPRLIRGGHGFMGITMDLTHSPGAKITEVTSDSPAERAKFRSGDIIVRVEGNEIANSEALRAAVSSKSPGEEVTMTIQRGAATIELKIVLGSNLDNMNPQMQRANMQNSMGGRLSRRRYDFPLAFQHDSALAPNQCGGPVINVNGEAIGLNVARNGRVASLALPVSVVLPLIEELKSGSLAPAVVNKEKIAEINRRLNEIEISLAMDPDTTELIEQELAKQLEIQKQAEQALHDAIRKAMEASNAAAKIEAELEITRQRLKTAREEKEGLERQREKLVTGYN